MANSPISVGTQLDTQYPRSHCQIILSWKTNSTINSVRQTACGRRLAQQRSEKQPDLANKGSKIRREPLRQVQISSSISLTLLPASQTTQHAPLGRSRCRSGSSFRQRCWESRTPACDRASSARVWGQDLPCCSRSRASSSLSCSFSFSYSAVRASRSSVR